MVGSRGKSFRVKRRNSRLTFVVLLLLSIVLFLGSRGYDDGFRKSRTEIEGLGATVLSYTTLPIRGFENFSSDVRKRFRAHSENEALRQEISRLSDVEARANALAIKLARFEKIFGVDAGSGIPERKIAARVVSEIDGPFVRSALLNVGANSGVTEGNAVMTIDGLLGHVIRVGKRSARILKLEDLNSRIAVMSKESQARAIMVGRNTRFPQLSFISGASNWSDGDVVITSGDDGLLPTGLPIGTVTISDDGDYNVILYSRQSYVDWVWVYPYEKIATPEENPIDDNSSAGSSGVSDGETVQSPSDQNFAPTQATDPAPNSTEANRPQ